MEKSIEQLQAMIETLSLKVEKLNAINEIKKTMANYEYWHYPDIFEKKMQLFALHMPDVSMDLSNAGVFVGPEAVETIFCKILATAKKATGAMFTHTLTTEYIEVADDLKTAKALWISPGLETYYEEHRHDPPDIYREGRAKMRAYWCWGKYSADFINKDGKWLIWHLKWWRDFRCDYYKSWVDDTEMNSAQSDYKNRQDYKPLPFQHPVRYHNPYDQTQKRLPLPALPEPYETFDDPDWIYRGFEDAIPPRDY